MTKIDTIFLIPFEAGHTYTCGRYKEVPPSMQQGRAGQREILQVIII